jgi:hypothetical protein
MDNGIGKLHLDAGFSGKVPAAFDRSNRELITG